MRQNQLAIRYQFCADQELMHGTACRHYSCESQLFHCAFALAICFSFMHILEAPNKPTNQAAFVQVLQ